ALDGAVTAGDTEITLLRSPAQIAVNSRLSIDYEDFHVWGQTGSTAEVAGGMNGTTAAGHADGTLIYVNPNFSSGQILRAMNDVLDEISSTEAGLFQVKTVVLTHSSATSSYDLTGVTDEIIRIDNVRYEMIGSREDWPRMSSFDLARDMPTADFASGYSFTPKRAPGLQSGARIQVAYVCPYTHIDADSVESVETQTGLASTATRILKVGAA
ncbi:MAG: hypothetical protein GY698_21645, partial [Actinomycetia bacterium]|nr:hypothetical protein [Actinomycetes bacterium]